MASHATAATCVIEFTALAVDRATSRMIHSFCSGVDDGSPEVYELDTTDISSWRENVEQRAEAIIDAFLKVDLFRTPLACCDPSSLF